MRQLRVFIVATCGLLSLICAGCAKTPDTLTTNYDPQKMEQAIAQGRATFDEFLARFNNPQPGDDAFHLKVKIEDSHGVEHFWVGDLNLKSEPFSGTIGNDPGIVQNVKLGQQYSFSKADISDWMYLANGKMQGNYTLRVELEGMPQDEADAIKKQFGW